MTNTSSETSFQVQQQPEGSRWTAEQWLAIQAKGKDILVSAAAGSGKTAVLVERIISRLTDPVAAVDVDQLLVVTFTNAAAVEMKKRVAAALNQQLQQHPEQMHLKRQLMLLNRASISTLHSFCMQVLRQNYHQLDIDPSFRTLEETEAALMREEVLVELFEDLYADPENLAFYELVDSFSNDRSDEYLQSLVASVYDFSRSHPDPNAWLQNMAEYYEQVDPLLWSTMLMEHVQHQLRGLLREVQHGLSLTQKPGGPAPYAANLEADQLVLEQLLAATSWGTLYDRFQSVTLTRLKPCRGEEFEEELKEQVKMLRDNVKKQLLALQEDLFVRNLEEHMQDMQAMAPVISTLTHIVRQFEQRYTQLKKEKAVVDFADLEHYCLTALTGTVHTADVYRKQFVEVMIDEYQDTNLVQERILQAVANDNLFMVGDVKQSIYRFRLADPGLFMAKYKSFTSINGMRSLDKRVQGWKIDLSRNFRSRVQVLEATNDLFQQIMDEQVGELNYDEPAWLRPGAAYPHDASLTVDTVLIDREAEQEASQETGQGEDDEQNSEYIAPDDETVSSGSDYSTANLEAVQLEARYMAQQIQTMISNRYAVYDQKRGQHRPLQYRDVVILLRSSATWAPLILDEFKQRGIPAYSELSGGYFEETEVAVVLSLLQTIDNPLQDIPLAAVLRSPVVGLDEEQLAQIRLAQPQGSFYEALQKYVQQAEADRSGLQQFLNRLNVWRTMARQGSLADLIWQLYRETGYYDFVSGLSGGEQRQANLRALYDRARAYEATSFRGLFRFLRFVERMREQGGDLGTARALGEQEDVVQIMTIHKSKGLEYPVVFVAGVARMFNQMDLRGPLLMHKNLGFGCRKVDLEQRVSYPTLPQLAIKYKLGLEQLAEEMRILYVALTRAKEKLFIVGTVRNKTQRLQQWESYVQDKNLLLPSMVRSQAQSYLDWIGPAVVRKCAVEEQSTWTLTWISPSALIPEERTTAFQNEEIEHALKAGQRVKLQSEHVEEVNRILSWDYPYRHTELHLAKQTVTELKRHRQWSLAEEEHADQALVHLAAFQADRPKFMQTGQLKSTERGTLMHTVMQHIPLERGLTEDMLHAYIQNMTAQQLFTEQEAAEIDVPAVLRFWRSELGERLLAAGEKGLVWREIPFSLGLQASAVIPNGAEAEPPATADAGLESETILIQGVIDCLVEEDDGYVLIDYKTDRISGRFTGGFAEARPVLEERYAVQVDTYAQAVAAIWKKPVKSAYLYFFDGGHVLQL